VSLMDYYSRGIIFDGLCSHEPRLNINHIPIKFPPDHMYPGLNMSRAFGDTIAHKEAGLTAEPTVDEILIRPVRNYYLIEGLITNSRTTRG
jgi:hypothetical protein